MKWIVIIIALVLPRVANAQVPEACLATVFANIDKKTGKVEKMAGEKFFCTGQKTNPKAFGIAHRSWPCNTLVLIVNIRNGRTIKVRVIDRGPFWNIPRSCSRDALGFASHACWKRGHGKVKLRNGFVRGNCVDMTPPVARRLRLRGKEPVIIYRLPKRRYNW